METKTKKSGFRIALKTILWLLIVALVFAAGYVGYVLLSYYRIGDQPLAIVHESSAQPVAGQTFTAATFNIGFGAYSPGYDFFMDGGTHSTGLSKEDVAKNSDGAAALAQSIQPDFLFVQEIDTRSTRSYGINQYQVFSDAFKGYDHLYAQNFHAPFLPYPFHDPHGSVKSGIAVFSRYALQPDAQRVELPITDALFAKMFDLDRCFAVSRVALENGKQLVLVNVHLSAYDAGGTIRAAQLERVQAFLAAERQVGNYIVMGGDFNHDLISSFGGNPSDFFKYDAAKDNEAWAQTLPEEFKTFLKENGYTFQYPTNAPTCRSTAYPYQPDDSMVWVIDGFITSENVLVSDVSTLLWEGQNYQFSDHAPVAIHFTLQ